MLLDKMADMSELIRPSTVLPAVRTPFVVRTEDGMDLVGEVALTLDKPTGSILMLHPLPTAGGMMDSHIFKKAANRLPALADITVLRFNTRGTESEAGRSDGEFGNGESEKYDVEAAVEYAFTELNLENLWVIGWSFGSELALSYAKDLRIKGLILLSPPLRRTSEIELTFWAKDGRPVIALVPEFDEFLKPDRIFSDYVYFSSYSNTWLDHCKSYVDMVIDRFNLTANSRVVEIASNDGYLLQYFIKKKI